MKKTIFFVLLTFIVCSTSCYGFISTELLKQAALKPVWQSAVALNEKEAIKQMTVLDDCLYIQTDSNYLFCLDRNSGKLIFATTIAPVNMPISEPSSYDSKVYFVAANRLLTFDMTVRAETARVDLPIATTAAAAASSNHLYFAGLDKHLHVTDLDGQHVVFKATADDVSAITTVLGTNNHIIFATNSGSIVAMDANSPKKLWQYNAVGAITAPLRLKDNKVYASGRDTNLYKLDASDGTCDWIFRTGSMLTNSPRPAAEAIYQYARYKGLYAIDKQTAKQLWLLPNGQDLLAESGSKAYVYSRDKLCIIMNNKTGKKICNINFAPVSSYAANTQDALIYIASGEQICCIEPAGK